MKKMGSNSNASIPSGIRPSAGTKTSPYGKKRLGYTVQCNLPPAGEFENSNVSIF